MSKAEQDPRASIDRNGALNPATTLAWTELAPPELDGRWRAGVGASIVQRGGMGNGNRDDALEIVSWNVKLGAGELPRVVGPLLRSAREGGRPLVALLQEVAQDDSQSPNGLRRMPAWSESTMDAAGRIAVSKGFLEAVAELEGRDGPTLHVCYVPSMRNGDRGDPSPSESSPGDRGNAILSTVPLSDLRAVVLPWVRQRRVAILATLETPRPLRIGCVHLDSGTDWAGRRTQAAALGDLVAADEDHPVLLAGDFNTIRGPDTEGVPDELRRRGFSLPSTFPKAYTYGARWVFGRKLDFMMLRPANGASITYRVARSRHGSDHRALIGSVTWT